ncbi:MAG: DUF86 domain-containing protein [Desulfuromonas sp.]
MAATIVLTKLDSLHRCLKRIQDKTPADVETLTRDLDCQDIIVLNLTRAVQVCVDIATHLIASTDAPAPQSMSQSFSTLEKLNIIRPETSTRMQKAVGFRNISVHAYQNIDWLVVYSIITQHLPDFEQFAREVYLWIQAQ